MVFRYFRRHFLKNSGVSTPTVAYDRRIRENLSEISGDNASVRTIWKPPVAYYFLIRKEHEGMIMPHIDEASEKLSFSLEPYELLHEE